MLFRSSISQADPWQRCNSQPSITADLALSVNGAAQAHLIDNVYGDYYVSVCKDSANRTYSVNVASVIGSHGYLTEADAESLFEVTFTPDATDYPRIAEGHGRIQSLSIGSAPSHTVTLSTKPIAWSDIQNCFFTPAVCVARTTTASVDIERDIRVGIRYAEGSVTGPGGEGFQYLEGMTWSAGAYYFWPRPNCPAAGGGDGITIEMGGPHLRADGALNAGFASIYIPAAAVKSCFGVTEAATYLNSLLVTRTENGATVAADAVADSTAASTGTKYVATATDDGGVRIEIPTVTFSKPSYRIAKVRASKSFSTLAKSAKVSTPKGGSVRVSVASTSKGICVVKGTSVKAFKKGTCKYTATSYTKKNKKSQSKSGSFTVK